MHRLLESDFDLETQTVPLVSEKFCNWIIMRRSVNLQSE